LNENRDDGDEVGGFPSELYVHFSLMKFYFLI